MSSLQQLMSRDVEGRRQLPHEVLTIFLKFWKQYDYKINIMDAMFHFNFNLVPLHTVLVENSKYTLANIYRRLTRNPKSYYLTAFSERTKDIFDHIIYLITEGLQIFRFFFPSLIGILDIVGDVIYGVSVDFADDLLKSMFIFFIVFPIFLQFLIWNIYFSIRKYKKLILLSHLIMAGEKQMKE